MTDLFPDRAVEAEAKLCECGCGQPAPILDRSYGHLGLKKGQARRFISGHNVKRPGLPYVKEDCGYETPCWVWQRHKTNWGYGRLQRNRTLIYAHVAFWVDRHGPVPDGLQLDHLCRIRACVNPDHLEPVTPKENVRRSRTTKLDDAAREAILASDEPALALAERFGVSRSNIYRIRKTAAREENRADG